MDDLAEVESGEPPWPAPLGWMWTRVGLAMNLVNGRAFKPRDWSKTGTPIVRIQNLNNPDAPYNYFPREVEPKFRLRAGDFLISWSGTPGTSFGAFIWNGPEGVLNQHIFRAEIYGSAFNLKFLRIAINARLDEMIAQAHGGVGLQHITKGKLEALPIPLPPLAVQERIVAKVDQLMALCDELEAKQSEKRKVRGRATTAALAALTSAESPALLASALMRVEDSFDALFDAPESVGELRGALRMLAITGRMSAQRGKDGLGATVLENVRRELASVGAEWVEPDVDAVRSDAGYVIPKSWAWARLENLTTEGPTNGFSPRAVDFATNVKSLTLTATTSGRFKPECFKYIDEKVLPDSPLWLRDGDLLVQRSNTIEYVGAAAVYRGPPHTFIYPDLMMRLRIAKNVELGWVHEVLLAAPTRAYFQSRASGTAGSMPKINQGVVSRTPIPVPPVAEQQRILAVLGKALRECDEMEEAIRARDRRAAELSAALIAAAVH